MNADIELKNHLITEFLLHGVFGRRLNETRGVVDGMDAVVRAFVEEAQPQIQATFKSSKMFLTNYTTQTYDNPEILSKRGVSTFFKTFSVSITIEYDKMVEEKISCTIDACVTKSLSEDLSGFV